jgi:adenosylmethionine-8-amino-7-oxononanoate aminotransferase
LVASAVGPVGETDRSDSLWLHFTTRTDSPGRPDGPPVYVEGSGIHVTDSLGRTYIDGLSALFCAQLGYGRRELIDAATTQMNKLSFSTNWGVANDASVLLAEQLIDEFPPRLQHVFFVNSGSEAVESAIKMAWQYHGARGEPERRTIVSRQFAYHGTSLGALSVTGIPRLRAPFEPLLPGFLHAQAPNWWPDDGQNPATVTDDAIADLERCMATAPSPVAAVFMEPLQNSGGCIPPPPGYPERVRELCDRYGALLVCDEVICAFGRLGEMTGSQRFGWDPDMLTFAKGVTSAYMPMGGLAFSRRIGDVIDSSESGQFVHGSTWGGHPVAAAVGIANLGVFRAEDINAEVRRRTPELKERLDAVVERHPICGSLRGEGYFWAIRLDLGDDDSTSVVRKLLPQSFAHHGLIARADDRMGPVIQIAPPLVCSDSELDQLVDKLEMSIAGVEATLGSSG